MAVDDRKAVAVVHRAAWSRRGRPGGCRGTRRWTPRWPGGSRATAGRAWAIRSSPRCSAAARDRGARRARRRPGARSTLAPPLAPPLAADDDVGVVGGDQRVESVLDDRPERGVAGGRPRGRRGRRRARRPCSRPPGAPGVGACPGAGCRPRRVPPAPRRSSRSSVETRATRSPNADKSQANGTALVRVATPGRGTMASA